ncbi:Uncharacterised protein [Amycolatopsis camponoti]|uniref:FHA domain-containing protein n=1 Tax=Amycolatopsis camponoti TaxID=2606593 RepID=A0A6I8LFA1_9PSEU|nr:FHA domain-containing protein [Amycolatopsis camponoti]VVJ15002.1 Uncharacterised protein [Amycolatopsis camponoti]
MSEPTYLCENGHRFSADAVPENGLCPMDRSPVTADGAVSEAPAAPAPRTTRLRAVRELRVVFKTGTVAIAAGTEAMVGRDPEFSAHAKLFESDDSVSRRHAVFGLDEDGRAWVSDHYATNLTHVNGEALPPGKKHVLSQEDSVRLSLTVTGTVKLMRGDHDA